MRWKSLVMCGAAAVLLSACATVGTFNESSVLRAKDKVAPALVHIRPVKEVYAQGRRTEVAVVGSGFIISPDGYVVTNEHVAGQASSVRCVLWNKEEVEATVVGTDPDTDIAVLKLQDFPSNLPTVKMGSSRGLEAGQTVLALGSPHGLSRSVSAGIISVTDRYLADNDIMVSPYNTWIQTDAAINPGNSGGPLVNLKGEVVGVNARGMVGAENVGFAIPIDTAREVVDEIVASGRVVRAWIGATLQEMTVKTDDPEQAGVVVGDVERLSPAAEAGVKPGDVLLSVNGEATNARFAEELAPVRKRIADLLVGEEAVLELERGGEKIELRLVPEEKSALRGAEIEFEEWGFTATELTASMMRRAQLSGEKGVMITGVQPGGLADAARIAKGDIVLKMDDDPVTDLQQFQRLYQARLENRHEQRLVLLDVKRGALSRYALIRQDAGQDEEGEVTLVEEEGSEHALE